MPPEKIKRYGKWFYVQSTGFYWSTRKPINGERLLHRIVWTKHRGPVPEGRTVHHIDNDWKNNKVSNLELRWPGDHSRHHCLKSWSTPEIAEKMRAGLSNAIKAAVSWHSTPEGIEWHRGNGKRVMAKLLSSKTIVPCKECGVEFECYAFRPSQWCSDKCSNRHFNRIKRARRKILVA